MIFSPPQIDVISNIKYKTNADGDDIASVKIASGTTYNLTRDYAESKGLKSGMIIKYTTHHAGKNPIHINTAIDISGNPASWPCKPYTLDAG